MVFDRLGVYDDFLDRDQIFDCDALRTTYRREDIIDSYARGDRRMIYMDVQDYSANRYIFDFIMILDGSLYRDDAIYFDVAGYIGYSFMLSLDCMRIARYFIRFFYANDLTWMEFDDDFIAFDGDSRAWIRICFEYEFGAFYFLRM